MRRRRAVTSSAAAFDPATLALSAFSRDWPGAASWTGTASAGTSGSRSWDTAAGSPGSAALNGHDYVTFNGTTQDLADTVSTVSDYLTVSAYTVSVLLRCRSAIAPSGSVFSDPMPVGDNSAGIGLTYTTSGLSWWHNEGARKQTPPLAITANTWAQVDCRYSGTTLEMRIDSGSWSQYVGSVGNMLVLGRLFLGRGYDVATFCDSDIAEFICAQSALADATLDSIRGYRNSRYGLSL